MLEKSNIYPMELLKTETTEISVFSDKTESRETRYEVFIFGFKILSWTSRETNLTP